MSDDRALFRLLLSVGTTGPFLLEDNPFRTIKRLVDYVLDRELGACVPLLLMFILVLSSRDNFLVVSTLGMA